MRTGFEKILRKVLFIDIAEGMLLTFRTMFRHAVTRRYPKVKRPVKFGYRGLHALAKDENGKMKCVGCGLCSSYCPSKCIYIYTRDGEDHNKVVDRYEIEVLRCVYCGFCVEACPFGAIAMSEHYEYSGYCRDDFYMTKEKLLENWNKYFSGDKAEKYFEKIWRPKKDDFSGYEGQAVFKGIKKGEGK